MVGTYEFVASAKAGVCDECGSGACIDAADI
jgi:hypothetical protein